MGHEENGVELAFATRKRQILDAALDLFSTKGYAQASIRDIANRVGLNVATIYYYFSNKEEILYEIINKRTQGLINKLREIQQSLDDPIQALKEMIKCQVYYSLEHWEGAKLIVVESEHNLHGIYLEKCRNLQRELYQIYLQQIQKIKKRRKLRDIDARVIVFSIFGMLNWLHRWYRKEGDLGPDTLASSLVELVLHGMLDDTGESG